MKVIKIKLPFPTTTPDLSKYTFTITDYLKTTSVSASDVYGFNILLYPTNYKDQQVERIVIGDSKNTTNKSNIKLSKYSFIYIKSKKININFC